VPRSKEVRGQEPMRCCGCWTLEGLEAQAAVMVGVWCWVGTEANSDVASSLPATKGREEQELGWGRECAKEGRRKVEGRCRGRGESAEA